MTVAIEMMYGVVRSNNELYHIGRSKLDGAPKGSGRYPLGSGKDPRAWKELSKKEKAAVERQPLTDEERADIVKRGDLTGAIGRLDEFTSEELTQLKSRRDLMDDIRSRDVKNVNEPSTLTPEQKHEIIRTADIHAANKNRESFSNAELQAVKDRFDLNEKINAIDPERVRTGKEIVNGAIQFFDQTAKLATAGVSVWNTAASVINSLNGSNLPVISLGEKKKDKKKDKK